MKRLLLDRVVALRWLAVPLGAYLAITVFLPMANGAASQPGFARHALWIGGACAAVFALALFASLAVTLVASLASGGRGRGRGRMGPGERATCPLPTQGIRP